MDSSLTIIVFSVAILIALFFLYRNRQASSDTGGRILGTEAKDDATTILNKEIEAADDNRKTPVAFRWTGKK